MLADCHIHMALDGYDWREAFARHIQKPDEAWIRQVLSKYRDAGVSYLRDGGDKFGAGAVAAKIAPQYGICYRTPIFPIYKNGHYGSFIGRGYDTFAQFQKLVHEAIGAGANFIKIMISGLMDFEHFGVLTDTPMPKGEIRDLIAFVHDQGLPVMVHANGDEAVSAAVAAGVDSVEHGAYLHTQTLQQLSNSDCVWVPTLSTIGNLIGDTRYSERVTRPLLELQMQCVADAAAKGAKIAPGSDAGAYRVYHGQGALDEYALLRQAIGKSADAVIAGAIEIVKSRF